MANCANVVRPLVSWGNHQHITTFIPRFHCVVGNITRDRIYDATKLRMRVQTLIARCVWMNFSCSTGPAAGRRGEKQSSVSLVCINWKLCITIYKIYASEHWHWLSVHFFLYSVFYQPFLLHMQKISSSHQLPLCGWLCVHISLSHCGMILSILIPFIPLSDGRASRMPSHAHAVCIIHNTRAILRLFATAFVH